jgi:hypothetical protein
MPRSEKFLVPPLFYDALSVEIPGNPDRAVKTLGQLAVITHRVGEATYVEGPQYTKSSLNLPWLPDVAAHISHVKVATGVDELTTFSLTRDTNGSTANRVLFGYFRTLLGAEQLSIIAPDRFRSDPIPLGFGNILDQAQQEVSQAIQAFFETSPPPNEQAQA